MHRYVVIDAFASEPPQGNPVAVFFDCDDLSGERMQRMAREMNLSESTFVLRPQQDGDARIRIFTPVNELPFAGHPLLGTAIALGAETDKDRLFLETRMGTVPFALERQDGKVVACSMQQPIPTWEHFSRPAELLAALGLKGPTFPSRSTATARATSSSAWRASPRCPRCTPTTARCATSGPGGELLRRRRAAPAQPHVLAGLRRGRGRRHRFRRRAAGDPPGAPPADPYGQQIEILQGVEIGRPSRMYARAEGAGERVSTVEVSGNGAASPKAGPTCERAERRNAVMGVNANISESLTGTIEAPFPEFEAPPANPMEVLRNWLERARRYGASRGHWPGHGRRAGPAVDADRGDRRVGRARVVFATHADSQKGRELAQNPWASGCCTGARAASRSSSTAAPNACPTSAPTPSG